MRTRLVNKKRFKKAIITLNANEMPNVTYYLTSAP